MLSTTAQQQDLPDGGTAPCTELNRVAAAGSMKTDDLLEAAAVLALSLRPQPSVRVVVHSLGSRLVQQKNEPIHKCRVFTRGCSGRSG